MEPSDLLRHVIRTVEHLKLRYMVTGSVATIYYGAPRFTNDIASVLKVSGERVDRTCIAESASRLGFDSIRIAILNRREAQRDSRGSVT